ncbi:MAG: AAA family ATPase [Phycisphaerales bacterium]|nr:AAA family ATPase [Phycisphaerales bacterium]
MSSAIIIEARNDTAARIGDHFLPRSAIVRRGAAGVPMLWRFHIRDEPQWPKGQGAALCVDGIAQAFERYGLGGDAPEHGGPPFTLRIEAAGRLPDDRAYPLEAIRQRVCQCIEPSIDAMAGAPFDPADERHNIADDPIAGFEADAATPPHDYAARPEAIVDGIVRRREVANVVATSKAAKTMFALGLCAAVAKGEPFLGLATTRGRVLFIDGENGLAEMQYRREQIAPGDEQVRRRVTIESTLGRLYEQPSKATANPMAYIEEGYSPPDPERPPPEPYSIEQLERDLRRVAPGDVALLVLDPLYVFLGRRDENSNRDMADLYARFHRIARTLDAGMLVIHHERKGESNGRRVVDSGAGAGVQARSAQSHVVLRGRDDSDLATLDVRARTFERSPTLAVRFAWPRWSLADVDPATVASKPGRGRKRKRGSDYGLDDLLPHVPAKGEAPATRDGIIERASGAGIPKSRAATLLELAEESGRVVRSQADAHSKLRFQRVK